MGLSDVTAHFTGSCIASSDDWRYSAWIDGNGQLWVAKQPAAGGDWETTRMDLLDAVYVPPVTDELGYPTLCFGIDGGIHLWVNMYSQAGGTLKHFWQDPDAPEPIYTWYPRLNPTDGVYYMPSIGSRSFYPMAWRVPSGRCRFYAAGQGGSGLAQLGRANGALWQEDDAGGGQFEILNYALHQGLDVDGAGGTAEQRSDAVESVYNWSPAPLRPVVQPIPGGNQYIEHWFWTWREGTSAYSHIIPCYAQYRSQQGKWYAIDNLPVAPPFDPITLGAGETSSKPLLVENQRGTAIGPGVEGWQAGGGMCLSADNRPIVVISRDPWYRIEWTGYGWTQTVLGTELDGLTIGGVEVISKLNIAQIRGRYWYLGVGLSGGVRRPYAFTADEPDPDGSGRRWLPDPADGVATPLSWDLTGIDAGSSWDVQPDLDALRRGDGIVILSGTETEPHRQSFFGHPSGATV